jgi:hypothetical protein
MPTVKARNYDKSRENKRKVVTKTRETKGSAYGKGFKENKYYEKEKSVTNKKTGATKSKSVDKYYDTNKNKSVREVQKASPKKSSYNSKYTSTNQPLKRRK